MTPSTLTRRTPFLPARDANTSSSMKDSAVLIASRCASSTALRTPASPSAHITLTDFGAECAVEACHAIAAGAQASCDVSGEFFTVEGGAHLLAHEFTAPNGEPDLLLFCARGCPSFTRNETLNALVDLRTELGISLRVRAHFLPKEQRFLIHDAAFSIADLLRIRAFSFTE